MKRILLLCVAFCAVISMNAQTLFSHDFEDGTLGGMTIVDVDGNTPNANVSAFADAWTVTENANIAEGFFAVSNSWYSPPAAADDWLITPAVEIPEAGYGIIFDVKAQDPNYADGYEVLVSTTDAEISSFTAILSVEAEETEILQKIISLDDYAGETVHVAIRNNSFDKYLLVVDNVTIQKIKQFDVGGLGIANNRWELVGTGGGVNFLIENGGAQELTSFDINYTVDGVDFSETVTGVSIAPFSSGEVQVGAFEVTEARNYDISFSVSNPNGMMDEDDSNDSGAGQIGGLSSVPKRMAVGEEGTGAWCGWCPRGHVFMEQMKEDYPEDFIGIAVHVGDVMEINGYAGDELGYAGYPSAHMNRSRINIDPSAFPANMDIQDERVPFDIDVEVTYNEDTREVSALANVTSRSQLSGDGFRLSMIMTEDHVQGTTAAYNQVNYYSGGQFGDMGGYENLPDPVPAADMLYEDVARAILGGFDGVDGSIPAMMEADEAASYTFTYTIPDEMDPTQMQAVVLLTNGDGVIVNAGEDIVKMPVNVFETPELIDAVIKPNPASDMAYIELGLEEAGEVNLQVIDLSGKLVMNRDYGIQQGNLNFPIDVTSLSNGVYMVKVESINGIATQRLVVSK